MCRRADGKGQLPFGHLSVAEDSLTSIGPNSEVEFMLGQEGRRDVAVSISCLPAGTIPSEEKLPGEGFLGMHMVV